MTGALGALEAYERSNTPPAPQKAEFGLSRSGGENAFHMKNKSKTPATSVGKFISDRTHRRRTSAKFHHNRNNAIISSKDESNCGKKIKPGDATYIGREMKREEKKQRQKDIQDELLRNRERPSFDRARETRISSQLHAREQIESESDDDFLMPPSRSKHWKHKQAEAGQGKLKMAALKYGAKEPSKSPDRQSNDWIDGKKVHTHQGGKTHSDKGNEKALRPKGQDVLQQLRASTSSNDVQPARFYGKSHHKTRASKPSPSASPKPPEVLDLVSDDDDEIFDTITKNDKYATCDGFDAKGVRLADANERREETRPQYHLLRCTRVSRIYIGRKGYGNSNWKEPDDDVKRDMGVYAYEAGVRIEEEYVGDRNSDYESWTALPYEKGVLIEAKMIEKVFVRAIENNKAKLYFCSLLLNTDSESTLRNVHMGSGASDATLQPDIGQGDPAKYITIIVGRDLEGVREDHKNLQRSLQRMCIRNKIELVKTKAGEDGNFLAAAGASLEKRRLWDSEDEKRVARSRRNMKRKLRYSEAITEIGRLDGDKDVYIVWPFGDEVTNAITLTNGDKRRLGPSQYLNDSLIDFKIRYLDLVEYKERHGSWHAYSTFFFSRINKPVSKYADAYRTVERWTKNVDIFTKEILVIPINDGEHWSVIFVLRPNLLVEHAQAFLVDKSELKTPASPRTEASRQDDTISKGDSVGEEEAERSPVLLFMDSLCYHNAKKMCSKIRRYLQYEYLSKKKGGFLKDSAAFGMSLEDAKQVFPDVKAFCSATESVKMVQVNKRDLPTQENGYDCGMYLIKYVECMLARWPEPSKSNIDKNFKSVIFSKGKYTFTSDDIDMERTKFQSILEALKPTYDKYASERLERELQERMAKSNAKKKRREEERRAALASGECEESQGIEEEIDEKEEDEEESKKSPPGLQVSTPHAVDTDGKQESRSRGNAETVSRAHPYPVPLYPARDPPQADTDSMNVDDSGTLDGSQSENDTAGS